MGLEQVTALSALVVAIVALGIALWEAATSRRHARLSVRPWITIQHDDHSGAPFALVLKNQGLGPAKLISVECHIPSHMHERRALGNDFGLYRVRGLERAVCWRPEYGEPLSAGADEELMRLPNDLDLDSPGREHARRALAGALFTVHYESIYGEPFTYSHQICGFAGECESV